jgi:hypothetical protein
MSSDGNGTLCSPPRGWSAWPPSAARGSLDYVAFGWQPIALDLGPAQDREARRLLGRHRGDRRPRLLTRLPTLVHRPRAVSHEARGESAAGTNLGHCRGRLNARLSFACRGRAGVRLVVDARPRCGSDVPVYWCWGSSSWSRDWGRDARGVPEAPGRAADFVGGWCSCWVCCVGQGRVREWLVAPDALLRAARAREGMRSARAR